MTKEVVQKKRKSPIALALTDDLETYLRAKAKASFRSITGEIAMRLEESRKREEAFRAHQQA